MAQLHPWGNQDNPIDQLLCWLMCAEGHFSNFKDGIIDRDQYIKEMEEVLRVGKETLKNSCKHTGMK